MIFVGDIALPSHIAFDARRVKKIFNGQSIVANLEGPVIDQKEEKKFLKKKILFNGSGQLTTFRDMGIELANLANNHMMDIPSAFKSTCNLLKENGIKWVGAGINNDKAAKPTILRQNNTKYAFLSFGWETIQCIAAKDQKTGVNPLRTTHILNSIDKVNAEYSDAVLVILMHWNYELEEYPQPFDRQLARRCIDKGAAAVIGCHSHCVQGIEIYKSAPIVYSLGNWIIPHNSFFSGKLEFPEKSYLQLAFEWDVDQQSKCHWFLYHPDDHKIKYLDSELLSDSHRIAKKTPFKNYKHEYYIKWFKKNRVKKLGLPIFKNPDDIFANKVKHGWVKCRDLLIRQMLTLGLKKIRRDI